MSDNIPQLPVAPQAGPLPASQKVPGLAVAALVLGIFSMIGGAILLAPMILSIVFGHVALSKIRKNPALTGSGIAIAGLALGYASILFGFVMTGLIAAMAIPAFEKVRNESLRKAMQNDARQIAAAAQQAMLENSGSRVFFHIDPATGSIDGPLSVYVKAVTKGTEEVDGVFENERDTFSLRNPRLAHGSEMVFDSDGRLISDNTQ